MSPRAKRLVLSAAIGGFALFAAVLPWWYTQFLILPGLVLAYPVWPEGIHSDRFLGSVGAVMFIGTIYLGTVGFWGGIAYVILKRRSR